MTKEEKIQAIEEITAEQKELILKSKGASLVDVFMCAAQLRMLEDQKYIIIAQPNPKYSKGGETAQTKPL